MTKIFLIIIFFILSRPVKASSDIIVTCDSNSCKNSSSLSLFDEINIAPGFSKTQIVTVINNRSDSCNLLFNINSNSIINPLSTVQMLSITENNSVKTAGSFNDFINKKNHDLGNIDSHQSKDYLWTTFLNQSLGNNYQLLNSFYNLDLNFTCGERGESDNSCHSSTPLNFPKNLKATPGQNSVTLNWDETDDIFSYYLISYSTEKHASTFASANIGGRGTTSFTINNLSANDIYYFKIRIGNLCAQGPFSEIVSATPNGQQLLVSPFSSSRPAILGQNSSLAPIPRSLKASTATKCFNLFPYAFILALLVNIIFSRYYFISFLVSLLSLAADYYLNKYLCRNYHYFYINNLLSFLLPLVFSLKKPKT